MYRYRAEHDEKPCVPTPAGVLRRHRSRWAPLLVLSALAIAAVACSRGDVPFPRFDIPEILFPATATPTLPSASGGAVFHPVETYLPPTLSAGVIRGSPTPDPVRTEPSIRTETAYYLVLYGDTLGSIAYQYNVSVEELMQVNGIWSADALPVGMLLTIPGVEELAQGPAVKVIPDSEVVYGPASALFDVRSYVESLPGAIRTYRETIDDIPYDAAGIIQLVAERYSVNPRLLLALLEYQSRLLSSTDISEAQRLYPMGYERSGWETLFVQLSWAADQLNTGYYLWRAGWTGPYLFDGGYVIVPGDGVNAGTVAVQYLFSQLEPPDVWRDAFGENGFRAVYEELFGDPFQYAVEPMLPEGLTQPDMVLPFEPGAEWSFTSGPHSAWGSGSAWAALDFAPPGNAWGCVQSEAWVTAIADGVILRSGEGQVLLDLDGDGFEQTGWVILYLHIESRDRVQTGEVVRAGDPIGHPSCEGGFSTGTHVHIARKYNGEWIAADGMLPFNLEGWVSAGDGIEYNGTLTRDGMVIEAYAGRSPINAISR